MGTSQDKRQNCGMAIYRTHCSSGTMTRGLYNPYMHFDLTEMYLTWKYLFCVTRSVSLTAQYSVFEVK